MNAMTFTVTDEIQNKIKEIASVRGISIEALLAEMTSEMVKEFDAHKLFLDMSEQGKHEVTEALELLQRK